MSEDGSGGDNQQNRSTPNDVGHSSPADASSSSANDKIYERKTTRKVIRVLTVVAYVFFVSLAAIMLSMYYIFLWDPAEPKRERLEARVDPQENDATLLNNASSKC